MCIRTRMEPIEMRRIAEQCHCYVQPVSRAGHRLGIATCSPPSKSKTPGYTDSSPSQELACTGAREIKSSIPLATDSSAWLKVRPKCRPKSHTSESPMRCTDGPHGPPSRFRLTYMKGPINCRRQGPFFCRCLALSYPPIQPRPAPIRACVRQRTVSRHPLEPPVFSHASSPLFGASSARMQAPFLHLALAFRALQPASKRRFSP